MFAFLLSACGSATNKTAVKDSLENIKGKVYTGNHGGVIIVYSKESAEKRNEQNPTLAPVKENDMEFSGMGFSTEKVENMTFEESIKYQRITEKGIPRIFSDATVIEDNGKKYLYAKWFPYRIEIQDNGNLLDLDESNYYKEYKDFAETK